jgi:hypothetical protein
MAEAAGDVNRFFAVLLIELKAPGRVLYTISDVSMWEIP